MTPARAESPAARAKADVVDVELIRTTGTQFRVLVTIRSPDTGWDAYADRFDVLDPEGRILGSRELLHPHETEQPFTRDLSNLRIPIDIREIRVRAHFKPTGYGGREMVVVVPGR